MMSGGGLTVSGGGGLARSMLNIRIRVGSTSFSPAFSNAPFPIILSVPMCLMHRQEEFKEFAPLLAFPEFY